MSERIDIDTLRRKICNFIGFDFNHEQKIEFETIETTSDENYTRHLIQYRGDESDFIPAYLLYPNDSGPHPAILIQHQHNSEWHWGKSEVCGLAGDPLQAFGVELAKRGFVVLAPDRLTFEDRRRAQRGSIPKRCSATAT